MIDIGTHIKEAPESLLNPLPCEDTARRLCMNQEAGFVLDTKFVGALILYCPASRTMRNKFLLFIGQKKSTKAIIHVYLLTVLSNDRKYLYNIYLLMLESFPRGISFPLPFGRKNIT